MNSKQRRAARRMKNLAFFEHNKGIRGIVTYVHCGVNYELELSDKRFRIFKTKNDILVYDHDFNFEEKVSKVSFLIPLDDPKFKIGPTYKVRGLNFIFKKNYRGLGWYKVNSLHFVNTLVEFEQVFDLLTDDQRREAIWNLDILRGLRV